MSSMRLDALMKSRSLRFWIATSMAVAFLPPATAAVGGFSLLSHGVIAAFKDVAHRQAAQIIPGQRLRLLILDTLEPVDEYADGGDATRPAAYRALREQIESEFAGLERELRLEPDARAQVERAREEWTIADRLATGLISTAAKPGDATTVELVERFHGEIDAAGDKLSAAFHQVAADVDADHDEALLFYERSMWLAGIAAGLSILMAGGGVLLIGRIISGSVDRLVEGASRFAEGDRGHRIDVQVPPELRRVADEFNRMAGRMHQSEELLADLAHRDGLTRLLNRRAYDEAIGEMLAHAQRFGEAGALLTLDVDNFKLVNDTHGHAAGDDVLRVIADVIAAQLRPFDKVFRTGGEEFAVLLSATDIAAAASTAERIRLAIKSHTIRFKDIEIVATVSIGVADVGNTANTAELMGAADAALYRAKQGGRDRIVVSDRHRQNAA
jgi:diguanylate cyclase (GGDEF)-like protein